MARDLPGAVKVSGRPGLSCAVDPQTEAIERLYRERFVGFRDALATVTGSYDTARDAVQEGFARALAARGQYRGEAPLAAWVWRIAFRVALGMRAVPLPAEVPRGCEPDLVGAEFDPVLSAALRGLSPRRRLVVFLRYFADFSYAEIAAALGISDGTVAATLADAHKALRKALDADEADADAVGRRHPDDG
jgi:DNA-directed RNA polymerase specialized sigma24 family protein